MTNGEKLIEAIKNPNENQLFIYNHVVCPGLCDWNTNSQSECVECVIDWLGSEADA